MTERRQAQRHRLQWNTEIRGVNASGIPFIELCTSSDLSISGILLPLKESLIIGSKVNILIQLPSRPINFMRYSGKVVRIIEAGIGINFDDTRPDYVTAGMLPDSITEIVAKAGTVTGGIQLVSEFLKVWLEARKGKVVKLRELDLEIEIKDGMRMQEIEEKLKQLKIFANDNLISPHKLL